MTDSIAEARAELQVKSREQVERETAYKWAARAIAAYQLWSGGSGDPVFYRDVVIYSEEALEHAAHADETGAALRSVREWMAIYVPRGAL